MLIGEIKNAVQYAKNLAGIATDGAIFSKVRAVVRELTFHLEFHDSKQEEFLKIVQKYGLKQFQGKSFDSILDELGKLPEGDKALKEAKPVFDLILKEVAREVPITAKISLDPASLDALIKGGQGAANLLIALDKLVEEVPPPAPVTPAQ